MSDSRNRWNQGEPSMDDLLDDPVMHLMMARDGVTPDDLNRLVRTLAEPRDGSARELGGRQAALVDNRAVA